MATVSDYIAERKKKLGVTGKVDKSQSSDYIQNRKMDLGIIPDTRPEPEPLKTPDLAFNRPGEPINTYKMTAEAARNFSLQKPKVSSPAMSEREARDILRDNKLDIGSLAKQAPIRAEEMAQENVARTGGLVERPPYLERVKQKVNEWPTPLQPLAAPLMAVAEAPAVRAIGEALGTVKPEDEGYLPVSGAGKKVGEIIAPIGAALTVPGGALGGGALYQQAGNVVGRYAPGLANSAGGRVAAEAIKGAGVGAPTGAGATLALNPQATGEEIAESALLGAAGGGLLGGALRGGGEAIRWGSGQLREGAERAAQNALRTVNAFDETIDRSPNLRARVAQDATRRAEGIVPDNLPPVSRLTSRITPQRDGPETMGISAFGKRGKFTNPEDTRTYIASNTDREPIDIQGLWDRFYSKTTDDLQRINQFDKYVEKTTGKKLSPEERSYYLALNSRGADMTANHILTERLVDAKGDVIGGSLKDITQQIPRRAYTNFTDYLIARHAETRMARGEKVYDKRTKMTPEKVAQKIADYERTYPEFKAISEQLYDWNDKLTKSWLVDTGIISPEMAAAWKEANPYWVPNKRFFSKLERAGKGLGAKRGFGNQNNPVKKYSPEGSERPIIDPIESMIEYVDKYVKVARRNEVMQTIIKNIQKDPENLEDFATILKREKVDPKSVTGEKGMDSLIDELDGEFADASNQLKKSDLDKGNVISGLVDGERVYLRVNDPGLLEAMVNLNPIASRGIIEAARKATNFVKLFTTGINPIFSLTRNIFRDIPESFIFSKTTNNVLKFGWDMLDSVVSTFFNRELYKRYKAIGGGHSSPVAADRNLLAQSKQAILPQQRQGLGLLKRAYSGLENLSNIVETAPRLAEFKRITKRGGNTYGSRVKGLYEANDITTNFKKKGNVTKEADAIFLYLNAAVQGLDKTIRTFKDNPKAATAKAFAAITVPTVALYALNHDDPDYEQLSNYQKDNFYNIPLGDGTFFKIPRPREVGVPFGAAVERAMRAWWDEDPEAFRDFANTVSVAFTPPGIPTTELAKGDVMGSLASVLRDTIAGPIVDITSNENFAGAPVVPGYLEGLSPRNQHDASTSEVGKKIGNILGMSPKQVDHLIRSYTGLIGQVGLPATTKDASFIDTARRQVTADPVFTNDLSRNFYELKEKVDTQYNDIRATGEVPEGYNDGVRKYLNGIAEDMSAISKALRAIDDMDISRKEKKDKKRELTELRNNLARTAYRAVKGYDQ